MKAAPLLALIHGFTEALMSFCPARRWLGLVAASLLAIATAIILALSPLYAFIRPAYVEAQYRRPGFPPSWRFSPQERARLSRPILLYLRGRITADEMAEIRTDSGEVALLAEEVQHLVDVRRVVDGFFITHGVACVVALLAGVALWFWGERRAFFRALRGGASAILGLIALILLSALVDFDTFFTRFHQIFFREGSWIFAEEDTLIQLYPLPFWVDTVIKLVLIILAEALVVWGVAWWLEKYRIAKRGAAHD